MNTFEHEGGERKQSRRIGESESESGGGSDRYFIMGQGCIISLEGSLFPVLISIYNFY
jgi:hypothetical protein